MAMQDEWLKAYWHMWQLRTNAALDHTTYDPETRVSSVSAIEEIAKLSAERSKIYADAYVATIEQRVAELHRARP